MFTTEESMILCIVAVAGWIVGRLSLRFVGNLLLGGTMWGGDFL